MDRVINLRMLSHPVNWFVVWVVLGFAAFAWSLLHDRLAQPVPATVTQS